MPNKIKLNKKQKKLEPQKNEYYNIKLIIHKYT